MWLICGLGNPGKRYENTRHNIGFIFVDKILETNEFKLIDKNKSLELYKGTIKNNICLVCKPLTYMNLSGVPVRKVMNFYKIERSKLIVIHDDIDLKLGKIKFKIGGGNGGHNGLSNLDEHIGVSYNRLRFGIDRPEIKELVNKYVLEKFNKNEKKEINKILFIASKYFHLVFKKKEIFLNKIYTDLQKIN